MTGYLVSFLVYTLAMIGVIFLALFVFKTFSNKCFSKKSGMLNIEESMSLSPRKTLYVINAENERFLIAADIDRTALIARLGKDFEKESKPLREDKSSELSSFDGIESLGEFASIIDFEKERSKKGPMMRELAKKLSVI
ncbi:MAG: flagellar biosynthetic protein FliO [Candidatus Gastranaerophilaceae bacterium]